MGCRYFRNSQSYPDWVVIRITLVCYENTSVSVGGGGGDGRCETDVLESYGTWTGR